MVEAPLSADAVSGEDSPAEPIWPGGDQRVVLLLEAASGPERRRLEAWVEAHQPSGADVARIFIESPRGRRRGAIDPQLEVELSGSGDPLMQPLRIAWLAPLRDGERSVRFSDLLSLSDPRDPGSLRQRTILRRAAERCRVVAGEPAHASQLRERWRKAGGADVDQSASLPEYVVRQATLALERGERRLRGARYKVPRLVAEGILGRPSFRAGLSRIARETGVDERTATRNAARYLREIAATHSPFVIDLVTRVIHWLYTQAYGEAIQYDREQLAGIAALAQRHPVVFLPTHKSNFDHLVLQHALHENGLPPNHTAGGINMNFFPVGPLVRRSGVFFIRRSFKDNPLYKHVLRSYIDYLIDKRFSLEWYIEGGRSRSGKMLPPRFGMLAYVVDAYRRAKSEDVFLIPVSIAYDQIHDVGSYADEQRGGQKERESFGWFIKFIRALRSHYGNIHIRFGEPLSLGAYLGAADPEAEPAIDDRDIDLQKLAFEVSDRINRVTPITPISLLTLALLGAGERALSAREAVQALRNLRSYVERRKLPTTTSLDPLGTEEGVREALEALVVNGVVTRFEEGREPVYWIGEDQQLTAGYYRNTIVHFFVNGAICELALLRAAERESEDPLGAFWDEAMELRDLLKFEFFFAEKSQFQDELRDELALHDVEWKQRILAGGPSIQAFVRELSPYRAHRVLRPFLEAYRVVADQLAQQPAEQAIDREDLVRECLGLGKQYQLQNRVHTADSVSRTLFLDALRLADNRGLLDPSAAKIEQRRAEFAEQIRGALRRAEAISAVAAARRAGIMH